MAFADEDIKIYQGDSPSPISMGEGEQSAARYVAHRDSGNLEKTRELGELLAQTLVGDARRLEGDPYCRQKLVLLSFLVTDELEAEMPDDMLRRSAAAAFQNRLIRIQTGSSPDQTDRRSSAPASSARPPAPLSWSWWPAPPGRNGKAPD